MGARYKWILSSIASPEFAAGLNLRLVGICLMQSGDDIFDYETHYNRTIHDEFEKEHENDVLVPFVLSQFLSLPEWMSKHDYAALAKGLHDLLNYSE